MSMIDPVLEFDQLEGIEKDLAELVLKRPAPGKHAARSAISHILKAFRLEQIDPEMALFRAITAEEEAARAIFDALLRRKYLGAERINWRKHQHKAAVMPFLMAVGRSVQQAAFLDAQLEIRESDGTKELVLHVRYPLPHGPIVSWFPSPPLNLVIKVEGKRYDFADEIHSVATDENFDSIRKFVDSYANDRNRLLYAAAQGVPRITASIEQDLRGKRANVFSMISVYLLIDTYAQQQAFVVQALDAFLRMIDRLPPPASS